MTINRSTYYNGKEFRYDDRTITFQRAWGGVSFDGCFACVVGEERYYTETRYYLLAEAQTAALNELADDVRQLEAEFGVEVWVGHLDKNVEQFLRINNTQAYNNRLRSWVVRDVPRVREYIDVQLDLVYSLLKPHKLLHFYAQSSIPAELQSVPDRKVKAEDHPKVEALANCISGMLQYGFEDLSEDEALPEEEPWY